ncbi:hypothetical protein F5148DRAFT_1206326, partial [Russula earlei]
LYDLHAILGAGYQKTFAASILFTTTSTRSTTCSLLIPLKITMRISLLLSIFGLAVGVAPSSALPSSRARASKTTSRRNPYKKRPTSSSALPPNPPMCAHCSSSTTSLNCLLFCNLPPIKQREDQPVLQDDIGYAMQSNEQLEMLSFLNDPETQKKTAKQTQERRHAGEASH